MHILLLHQYPFLAKVLQKSFQYENIYAEVCSDPVLIWQEMCQNDYHAAVIYHKPPEFDSLTMITQIKKIKPDMPLFIMNEKPDLLLEKQALKLEALVLNEQSSSLSELAQFIKNDPENKAKTPDERIHFKDLVLDVQRRIVVRQQKSVFLRNKEFLLLEFFMKHIGIVLSRSKLLEYVWARDINLLTNTVDVHVNKLRQKIDHGFEEKLIKTVSCVGYVFGADL